MKRWKFTLSHWQPRHAVAVTFLLLVVKACLFCCCRSTAVTASWGHLLSATPQRSFRNVTPFLTPPREHNRFQSANQWHWSIRRHWVPGEDKPCPPAPAHGRKRRAEGSPGTNQTLIYCFWSTLPHIEKKNPTWYFRDCHLFFQGNKTIRFQLWWLHCVQSLCLIKEGLEISQEITWD